MAVTQHEFDFHYRPATYWPDEETDETKVNRIKGKVRRDTARQIVEAGGRLADNDDHSTPIFEESVPDEMREELGRIHPALMGGEYLPDLDEDDVEIARIELESTLADVISVRATRVGDRIRYEIVDEYEMDFEFTPESSQEPLDMGQLVELIDNARHEEFVGLTDSFREMNFGSEKDPEALLNFVSVSSLFYPELEDYYRFRAEEWVKAKQGQG